MAFAAGTTLALTRPSGRNGFCVDRNRPCKIAPITKLTGDTTGSWDTGLEYVKEIIVLKSDLSVDSTAVGTTGSEGAGGTFTTTLTSLSTGYTAGYIIAIGGRN